MARPKTKGDLLNEANKNYADLWEFIESMNVVELETEFDFSKDLNKKEEHWKRDKNLRDILVHLYEWHRLLLNWVDLNRRGIERSFLPEPYTWRTYGGLNVGIWAKHQSTSYEESKKLFISSHLMVMRMIEMFSEEELFTKDVFPWVGGSTLGSYCVSATASHYDWALKKIKAHRKNCKGLI